MWSWPLFLLALVIRASAAGVQAEAATAPQVAADLTGDQRLDAALVHYQAGRYEEAREGLAALINDPALDDVDLRQQARVYLGELLYVRGQQDAAFKVFETVLLEDPGYRIDPFRHPPDVCGFFEVVRASVAPMRPAGPPTVELPRNARLGFGLYQYQHQQPGRGTLFLVSQTALGLTSLVSFGVLLADHGVGDAEERRRIVTLRAVQWSTTAGFWGMYTWSVLDARAGWHDEVDPPVVGIGASGRW